MNPETKPTEQELELQYVEGGAQRAALMFSDRVRLDLLLESDFDELDDEYPEQPRVPGE